MVLSSIIVLVSLVFSYLLFGVTGIRVVLGVIFTSFPFYLMLNNFELAEGEKIVFSILLGLTLYSSLVYILGLVISFRISIAVIFFALVIIALAIRKYRAILTRINN